MRDSAGRCFIIRKTFNILKLETWNLFIPTIISETAREMSRFFKNFIPHDLCSSTKTRHVFSRMF